jgi:sugar lactone lactonase YvrE
MSIETYPVPTPMITGRSGYGSAPWFSGQRNAVSWLGSDGLVLNEFDLSSSQFRQRRLAYQSVAAVPRRSGEGMALVHATGFGSLHNDTHDVIETLPAEAGLLNTGQVDPRGRLWAASASSEAGAGRGRLRRWDGSATSVGASRGFERPTGIGWSPDGLTMYLLDGGTRRLYGAPFLPDEGVVGEFEGLCDLDLPGEPAGLAVDVDGLLWIGVRSLGQIRRIDPKGRLVGFTSTTSTELTGCAFDAHGGLYITADAPSTPQSTGTSLAGSLCRLDTPTRGVTIASFDA